MSCNFHDRNRFDREDVLGIQSRDFRRCDCNDLFDDIKRNDFVKVNLKSSKSVQGNFLGVFGNVVILFDERKDRINSTKICCEDVVSVTSFGDRDDSKLRKKVDRLEDKIEDLLRRNRKNHH
jgi:hypothetical protein